MDYNSDSIFDGIIKVVVFYSVCIIISFTGIIYLTEKNITCPQLGNSLQKETKFNFWAGGCFIKLQNGNWVSSYSYTGVSIESR